MENKLTDKEIRDLTLKVEERQKELKEEWGDDEFDIIEVNEILRDEFSDPKYESILIDLGVNDSMNDLGLEEVNSAESINDINNAATKDNIVRTLLLNKPHVREIYLDLMGYEEIRGKLRFKGKSLIPKEDANYLVKIIGSLYQPQTLGGKLGKNIKFFDDHFNTLLNNFRSRLTNYSDDVCTARSMRIAIDLVLNEVNMVRNAIISGRIGDLTRDISINSYNEKEDLGSKDERIEKLKNELRV